MRRWGPFHGFFAFMLIVIGVLILFAMLLPPGFWWFLIGLALIIAGFCYASRR